MNDLMDLDAISHFPLLNFAKSMYIDYVSAMKQTARFSVNQLKKKEDIVELYHGTTAVHLSSILKEGLKPNAEGFNRWENEVPPLSNVSYLTDKWHPFFAAHAFLKVEEQRNPFIQSLIEGHLNKSMKFTGQKINFPCFIKVRVNKNFLIADEDFFLSRFMNEKTIKLLDKFKLDYDKIINENAPIPKEFFEELGIFDPVTLGKNCLNFNGTVAYLGEIPPEDIVEVTSMASFESFKWVLIDESTQYRKDYVSWQSGNGKGKLKNKDIQKMLSKASIDRTVPITSDIKNIVADYDKNKLMIRY